MLLYDMRGREMIRKDLSEINENISLDTLPAGQYLAIFYKGKAVYSQQINVSR
jgi:effector-binding domain-containing protein